jgi:hypothetical protein
VTFSNSISVAEHAVMMILSLVRDYIPAHDLSRTGAWDIADCVKRSSYTVGRECSAAVFLNIRSAHFFIFTRSVVEVTTHMVFASRQSRLL